MLLASLKSPLNRATSEIVGKSYTPHHHFTHNPAPASCPGHHSIPNFNVETISKSLEATMAENGTALPSSSSARESSAEGKAKGKAIAEDVPRHDAVEEDDEDDDEDDDDEDDENAEGGEEEEDGMEEIDLNNIVEGGRRTRGANIDFAKAAEQLPAEDEDEEDDDDFQPPADDTEMSG
ncbi:hypothetical protein RJ55_03893 [Drechmeria coniospora]|nr:hypothetical protein RJ55_03893 [Drechmeria coniospora]